MDGISARLGSNLSQRETPVLSEFPQFLIHDKPPPSYEESQQQHGTHTNEPSEVSQADKLAIYRHPLFPLLAMLFDKCEWATGSQEGPSSQVFQNDIRSFLLHLGQGAKSLMSGNDETDSLVSSNVQYTNIICVTICEISLILI